MTTTHTEFLPWSQEAGKLLIEVTQTLTSLQREANACLPSGDVEKLTHILNTARAAYSMLTTTNV